MWEQTPSKGSESGTSEVAEQGGDAGTGAHTQVTYTRGAIPRVAAASGAADAGPSASDRAFGVPGEPPEATNARNILLQVDPSYGASPDLSKVAPIIKQVIEAAAQAADRPVVALQILDVVKPYEKYDVIHSATTEMRGRLDQHARKLEVQTGGSATESTVKEGPTPKVEPIAGTPIDAPLVSSSFLGLPARAHPVLLQRLAKAEAHLQSTMGKTGADLAAELGVHAGDPYRIWRRPPGGYHCFGLAIDINYVTNPYIGGQAGGMGLGDQQANAAIFHACLLTGRGTPVSSRDSWKRGKEDSTNDLWAHFHEANQALEAYLTATPEQVAAWIAAGNLKRALTPPPGLASDDTRLRAADADAWVAQIKDDMQKTHGATSDKSDWWMTAKGGGSQRKGLGFMDLDQRLVVALRDVGGLAWGAADFDETHNGDMQHFDCRHDYSYAQLTTALAKLG